MAVAFITVKRTLIEIDGDGFIREPDKWTRGVAAALAATEGVGQLSGAHWKLINYLRGYYRKHGIAPMFRQTCRDLGMNLDDVYWLFPTGLAKGACKAAGLPKPTGCV
jgi:TusE/DsrC/DsvC family sulfur relay protein